jgi:ribosomal protein S18 acetylase RimI-like enzyme
MKICLAKNITEVEEIKSLQTRNLKKNISLKNRLIDGFLTASYSINFLNKMNELTPAIIAKQSNRVIGYVLATDRSLLSEHPLLRDLSSQINKISFKKKTIGDFNYLVVGQLCVAKEFRGQGVAQQLYFYFKKVYKNRYPFAVTDVDQKNSASIGMHLKVGFETLSTLNYGESSWNVVIWDWENT